MRCDNCLLSEADADAREVELHVTCGDCLATVEKEANADIANHVRAAIEAERDSISSAIWKMRCPAYFSPDEDRAYQVAMRDLLLMVRSEPATKFSPAPDAVKLATAALEQAKAYYAADFGHTTACVYADSDKCICWGPAWEAADAAIAALRARSGK